MASPTESSARRAGVRRLLCPAESAAEAELAGIEAVPISHLAEAVAYLRGECEPEPVEAAAVAREPAPLPDLASSPAP